MARRTLLVVVALAALLAVGCSDSDSKPDGGGTVTDSGNGGTPDAPVCRRPPLSLCEPPGTNPICPNNWFCPGCNCTGPQQAAACDPLTQDCRRFCTGCYPDSYLSCADSTNPPPVLGRCGYCFTSDAGYPKDCDKLGADAGAGP